MRSASQPSSVGSLEKPYPGIDGSTRWNASLGVPPCAVGSVSGPTVSSSSMTEPGQPCVMISGNAFSCRDLAPVVLGRPIAGELPQRRQLHALRPIGDRFPLRPPRCVDAPAQFGEL